MIVVKIVVKKDGFDLADAIEEFEEAQAKALEKEKKHAEKVEKAKVKKEKEEIKATTDFPKYGEKYRYYTFTTNRWDLATFEKTGTDIGRFLSGFALKVPSGRTVKRERLRLLNSILDLGLTEDQIHASTTN